MISEKDPYIKGAYNQLQTISQDKQKRLEYEAISICRDLNLPGTWFLPGTLEEKSIDTPNLSFYKLFRIFLKHGPKNICTILPIYNLHFL